MKGHNRYMFFLLAFFIHVNAFNQDFRGGYIIKESDTLRGFVANRSKKLNGKSCVFKLTKKGTAEEYLPPSITAFGIDGYKQYELKQLPAKSNASEAVFVEALVKGVLSLYTNDGLFYLERDTLIQLEPGIGTRAGQRYRSNRYIGSLNYAMRDCRQNNDKVPYTEDGLVEAVIKYNQCKGSTSTVIKTGMKRFRFNVAILGGVDMGQVNLQGLEKFSYVKSYSAPIGLGLRVSLPRLTDRFFGLLDVFFDQKLYQVYDETTVNGTLSRSDFLFKYAAIRIPVGIQYNFAQETATFYIKGGFVHSPVLNLEGKVASENETNRVVYPDVTSYNFTPKSASGFWIGSGYQHKVARNTIAFAEIRYEVNSGYTNPIPSSKSSGTNLGLLAGIIF